MTHKEKILIVDDDPLNVKLMIANLGRDQYECIPAQNGLEALERVDQEHPDLILLDIMMPGMDGYQVTAALKENPATRDIPIILITALDGTDNKVRGLEAGADEFLNKPVNKAELVARVKSLLRLKQYGDQLKARHQSEIRATVPLDDEGFTDRKMALPTILIVEDDEKDARLIQMQLYGHPCEIRLVARGEEALSLAQREKIDLILLDILLPGMDGFEVARRLKESEETRNIQIVALTCMGDMESKIKGIELGFDDYLVKPSNVHELKARVNSLIKKKAYLDRLQDGYRSAVRSAITDRLTGLYNYAYFLHFLETEIKRSNRHRHSVALIMMDIDDFKLHNDTLGHLAGDEILKEFGRIITQNIREIDLGFRYGGEEFAVVLPYSDLNGTLNTAERLRQTISDHPFRLQKDAQSRRVTVSVGIAAFPSHAGTLEEFVRKADEALYEAKRGGKNHVCVCKGISR
jgi:two-component system cell cycle response regulator